MSDDENSRFEGVDKAVEKIRKEFDEAISGSKQTGSKASKEVREAIDELEQRVEKLRERENK